MCFVFAPACQPDTLVQGLNKVKFNRLESAKLRLPKKPLDRMQLRERLVHHTGLTHTLLLALFLLSLLFVLGDTPTTTPTDKLSLTYTQQLYPRVAHALLVPLLSPLPFALWTLYVWFPFG